MTKLIQKFLEMVALIKATKPKYQKSEDGRNGLCDCIGLIIGALRRMGFKWTGIHGSNYAARKALVELKKIQNSRDLEVGDWVFKARNPEDPKYDLPSRYKKGGAYYNGDLKDYYHVGVVTRVNPLEITHMTSPTVKVDTSLGKWEYYGKGKLLQNSGIIIPGPTEPIIKEPLATEGAKAIVTAASGRYVKMRQQPSVKCGLYEEIPVGAVVTLEAPGEEWAKVSYGRRKGWYMMAKFLKVS